MSSRFPPSKSAAALAAALFSLAVATALPAGAADPVQPDPFQAEPAQAEPAQPQDRSAVYDERARKLLAQEQGKVLAPHPLAKGYPGHYVVVCEAGCQAEHVAVVYVEPESLRGPVDGNGDADPQASKNLVNCVGGCYYGNTSQIAAVAVEPAADGWISNMTVTPSDATPHTEKPASAGRWYDRINPGTAR